uniref:Fibronectin type-III domain-containing protein n=1 Tax=Meloidogyne hapla TaxID=6305 RepID=A0A1I8B6K2_MELHA
MKSTQIISSLILFLFLSETVEFVYSQTISPPCSCLNVKPNFGTNSNIPQQLCVPSLAYDQTSIWLTWNKPDNYENIVDFNIYMNGKKIGNSKTNAAINTLSGPYIQNFYKNDLNNFHTKILFTTYLVKGLNPNTIYTFIVRAVDYNGAESGNSNQIVAKTANNYEKIVDITTVGAIGDGTTLNTQTIQKAIDLCSNSTSPFGCKVLIPKGIFLSGPLFLRSQMTFELANGAILRATSNAAKYPLQYGSTPSAFFNAYNGSMANIRLVGPGTIDGNGWKLDFNATDELGKQIPVYVKGSASTVKNLGVLAANQSIINVRFQTYNINNGDGIDIGRSTNIQIIGSFFDTGDDCIAMGTGCGSNAGQSPPVQCILIKNNYFRHGHGAPAFGGSAGDWIKDVLVEDNIAFLTDNGIRFKSSPQCGGGAQNVYVRDIAMISVGSYNNFTFGGRQFSGDITNGHPFVFMLDYDSNPSGNAKTPASFKDVKITRCSVDNIKPTKSGEILYVVGHEGGNIYQPVYNKNIHQHKLKLLDTGVFDSFDITNYGNNINPWSITKSKNIQFRNVATMKLNKLNYA